MKNLKKLVSIAMAVVMPSIPGSNIKLKSLNQDMFATTLIRITYVDKYTKQEYTSAFALYKSVD